MHHACHELAECDLAIVEASGEQQVECATFALLGNGTTDKCWCKDQDGEVLQQEPVLCAVAIEPCVCIAYHGRAIPYESTYRFPAQNSVKDKRVVGMPDSDEQADQEQAAQETSAPL